MELVIERVRNICHKTCKWITHNWTRDEKLVKGGNLTEITEYYTGMVDFIKTTWHFFWIQYVSVRCSLNMLNIWIQFMSERWSINIIILYISGRWAFDIWIQLVSWRWYINIWIQFISGRYAMDIWIQFISGRWAIGIWIQLISERWFSI